MNAGNWITLGIAGFGYLVMIVGSYVSARLMIKEIQMGVKNNEDKIKDLAIKETSLKEIEMEVKSQGVKIQENRSDMNDRYINQEKTMIKLENRMDSNFNELFGKFDKLNDYLLNHKK